MPFIVLSRTAGKPSGNGGQTLGKRTEPYSLDSEHLFVYSWIQRLEVGPLDLLVRKDLRVWGGCRGGAAWPMTCGDLPSICREALAEFDPSLLPPEDCLFAVEKLAATEKACAAVRVRAAARAVEHGAHREQEFSTGVDWLAQQMGSTNGDARNALEAARSLEECPETKAALLAGELSLAQAHEIGRSHSEMPDAEHDLVELARTSGLGTLRDAVRERKLRDADPARLHERQHRLREFRHWQDREGMIRFSGALTPEVGLPFVNRIEADAERRRRDGRAEGVDEPFCRARSRRVGGDALGLGTRPCDSVRARRRMRPRRVPARSPPRRRALPPHRRRPDPRRPRPREFGEDAFVKAVIIDGVNIQTVKHFGRHINAELRTALELGLPPGLQGAACVEAECRRRYGLEWDHVDPVANGGPTSYDNLRSRAAGPITGTRPSGIAKPASSGAPHRDK